MEPQILSSYEQKFHWSYLVYSPKFGRGICRMPQYLITRKRRLSVNGRRTTYSSWDTACYCDKTVSNWVNMFSIQIFCSINTRVQIYFRHYVYQTTCVGDYRHDCWTASAYILHYHRLFFIRSCHKSLKVWDISWFIKPQFCLTVFIIWSIF